MSQICPRCCGNHWLFSFYLPYFWFFLCVIVFSEFEWEKTIFRNVCYGGWFQELTRPWEVAVWAPDLAGWHVPQGTCGNGISGRGRSGKQQELEVAKRAGHFPQVRLAGLVGTVADSEHMPSWCKWLRHPGMQDTGSWMLMKRTQAGSWTLHCFHWFTLLEHLLSHWHGISLKPGDLVSIFPVFFFL